MALQLRTIALGIAIGCALVAVSPPAAAADVGDLLGGLLGGGSQPSPPPQSGPAGPSPAPSGPPTAESAPPRKDPLLAPEASCRGQSDPGRSAVAEARTMACMLSYARVAKGLSALRFSRPLHVAATHRARDIRRCDKLSHEACGRSLSYWLERVGFLKGHWVAGEMLAAESGRRATAQGTVGAWLASAEHRAVLFHRRFDLVGVGTVRGRFRGEGRARIWVAQLGYRS